VVATTEEREPAAATAARAARLAAAELAAARADVEAATTTDATRVATTKALRGNSTNNSVFADGSTNDKLRLAREAAREQAA
jgi:hypothetical protein